MASIATPEELDSALEVTDISMGRCDPRLPWDNFSSWITCFCVVTFDLELGQVIEKIYPEHTQLSDREKVNICYLAFPDSNTGCMGDTQFHFRIRSSAPKHSDCMKNADSGALACLKRDPRHLYGYVLFRQVKDSSVKRGYFQKSLVVISRLPYVDLFLYLAKAIAPEYFASGDIALETVCNQIDKWQTPQPGATLQLPVMGNVLQMKIPPHREKSGGRKRSISKKSLDTLEVPSPYNFSSFYEPRFCHFVGVLLPHMHLLWELVLVGEPVVVMAPSPAVTSQCVQSLLTLIQPLDYVCDYRPYFTIHDSELKEYTTKTQSPPRVILGVTNPFFAKTLQHWPHVVRIGEMPTLTIPKSTTPGSHRRNLELRPGVYTKYKASLDRDKLLIKRLRVTPSSRPVEAQDVLLKKHFLELTESFMIPLERYIGSLMPLQRSISPWKTPPKLRRFNVEEFIQTLPNYGPQLTSRMKGNWQALYKKFFRSPNFEGWFKGRRQEVNDKLEMLHLEALCLADIAQWTVKKDEVEIVDLYIHLKQKLMRLKGRHPPVAIDLARKLKSQMDTILAALPEDLQVVVRQS